MKRVLTLAVTLIILLAVATCPSLADDSLFIRIPDISVDAPVIPVHIQSLPGGTTWDVSHLRMNAGVFVGLGTFGQAGNTVVGAHSEAVDGSPDLFFNLDNMQIGNQIVIEVNGQQLVYEVAEVYRAAANDLQALHPTQDERLTLITCDRSSYNSATGDYSRRIIVVAMRNQG